MGISTSPFFPPACRAICIRQDGQYLFWKQSLWKTELSQHFAYLTKQTLKHFSKGVTEQSDKILLKTRMKHGWKNFVKGFTVKILLGLLHRIEIMWLGVLALVLLLCLPEGWSHSHPSRKADYYFKTVSAIS